MCLCVIYVRCIFLLSFWTGVLIEKQSDRKRCCRDRGTAKPWHQNHEAIFGIAHKWQTVKKYIIIFLKKRGVNEHTKKISPTTHVFFLLIHKYTHNTHTHTHTHTHKHIHTHKHTRMYVHTLLIPFHPKQTYKVKMEQKFFSVKKTSIK